jgi:hypothetical protein
MESALYSFHSLIVVYHKTQSLKDLFTLFSWIKTKCMHFLWSDLVVYGYLWSRDTSLQISFDLDGHLLWNLKVNK